MKKKTVLAAIILLVFLLLTMTILSGCARKSDVQATDEAGANEGDSRFESVEPSKAEEDAVRKLSDEQALAAIRNYCYSHNPDLEGIVNAGEYPVYWDISSSDEREIVVLFRSYTGAQSRYYIDRLSGETYVTEFVPGITSEEQRTDESFNIREYFGE